MRIPSRQQKTITQTKRQPRSPFAIFFDLDGVLIETELETFQFYQRYLKRHYNVVIPDDAYHRKAGRKSVEFFNMILTEEQKRHVPIADIVTLKRKLFNEQIQRFVKKIPSATTVIRYFHKKGIPLGLVSQNEQEMVDTALNWLKIKKYFRVIVTLKNTMRLKPDPKVYLDAAKKIRYAPSSCIVIEDSVDGVAAAKRAGMYCIALEHPYTPTYALAAADTIIRSLAEVPSIVERLLKYKGFGK